MLKQKSKFKYLFLLVCIVLQSVSILSDTLTFAWSPSVSPNIREYRLYFSKDTNSWTHVKSTGLNLQTTIDTPEPGTWYFIATATDVNGLESLPSNMISYVAQAAPIAPAGMKLTFAVIARTTIVTVSSNLIVIPNP